MQQRFVRTGEKSVICGLTKKGVSGRWNYRKTVL
jgi:hypothetical protein